MLAVALAALRARRASGIALWLLAALVTAVAVGAPYYLLATLNRVVVTDVTSAPAEERLVQMTRGAPLVGSAPGAVDDAFTAMRESLALPDAPVVEGMRMSGSIGGAVAADFAIASRDGVCDHVSVEGACPTGTGDVMVSRSLAGLMRVHVGDQIPWPATVTGRKPVLRVVGVYQPRDPADPYWGTGLLTAGSGVANHVADAMFVTRDTLMANSSLVTTERQLLITVDTVRALGPDQLRDTLGNVRLPSTNYGWEIHFDVQELVARIDADIDAVRTSVPLLAVETVLLGWFALALVLRAVTAARRSDVGLLLLRGTPRARMWWVLTLQSAVPVIAGVPFGAAVGWVGARLMAGPVPPDQTVLAAAIAGGGALVVLVGALVAAGVAERRGRRTPIPELLRRTPARRRGWRADVVDVIVLGLAVFGLVQTRLAGADASGIVVLTPALVALAAGLLAGRLLGPVAANVVGPALRSGRTTALLTATYLARRGGLDRVVALLVISVTLTATATMAWHAADVAQHRRAAVEVGANEVIDVSDASPARLLTAVRAADPDGRYLMAVASATDLGSGTPVLAVDSPRLGAVLSAGGWPAGNDIARLLRPAAPTPTRITTDRLVLVASGAALPKLPVTVLLTAVDAAGVPHTASFGPLAAGSGSYAASLDGCGSGCDLASLQLATPLVNGKAATVQVVVRTLTAGGGTIEPAVDFTDRLRWHTSISPEFYGPILTAGKDGLRIDVDGAEEHQGGLFDPRVLPVDTPLPLPAVVAGGLKPGDLGGVTSVSALGDLVTPLRVVRTVPLLPSAVPAGVYVDLEYAVRIDAGAGSGARGHVWVGSGTPTRVISALRASGLTFGSITTMAGAESAYRQQSTQSRLWFSLAGALMGLLIGVVALLLVAVAERDARRAEFAALRQQGLPAATVRRAARYGYGILVLVSVAIGLLAVAASQVLGSSGPAIFSDGWHVLPSPALGSGWGWPIALAAGVPLLAAAYVSARQLTARSTRDQGSTR